MIRNWKTTLYNYRHAALLLYFVPYMLWFGWLQGNARPEHWAGSWIDTLIPFQEVFVIPYLLWFFYVAAAVGYFLVRSKPDYFRLCAFLFGGMTVCLRDLYGFPQRPDPAAARLPARQPTHRRGTHDLPGGPADQRLPEHPLLQFDRREHRDPPQRARPAA